MSPWILTLGLLEPASVKVTSSQSKNLSGVAPLRNRLTESLVFQTLLAPSPAQIRLADPPAPTIRSSLPALVLGSTRVRLWRTVGRVRLATDPLNAPPKVASVYVPAAKAPLRRLIDSSVLPLALSAPVTARKSFTPPPTVVVLARSSC